MIRALTERWMGLSRRYTVRRLNRMLRRLTTPSCSKRIDRSQGLTSGRLLYVAASALPYHISGYTTRTQAILCALQAIDPQVVALTRAGYPQDRGDRLVSDGQSMTVVDSVQYHHLRTPKNRWPVAFYAPIAARKIRDFAKEHGVTVIHAASNHVNALPALLAARELGLPFQYEMRGLWELTRVSRMPWFENSQAYFQGLELEGLVARSADKLFVISEQLGDYMVRNYGVKRERLHLLPNCVDPESFNLNDVLKERVVPKTLGYAGSLIGYEGLDVLIDAIALLVKRGQEVTLTIAGDGEERANLENQVRALNLSQSVKFLGKVSPDKAKEVVQTCDVICIPRKPYEVCKIVTPIKLVEAMAMQKSVIVPDLPVFRDELGPDPACWMFRAGDAQDLARVIDTVLGDDELRVSMAKKARQYALTQRGWGQYMGEVLEIAQAQREMIC